MRAFASTIIAPGAEPPMRRLDSALCNASPFDRRCSGGSQSRAPSKYTCARSPSQIVAPTTSSRPNSMRAAAGDPLERNDRIGIEPIRLMAASTCRSLGPDWFRLGKMLGFEYLTRRNERTREHEI